VLLHDDLLATGGTAGALCELVSGLGAQIVGSTFLVELSSLGGRKRLAPCPVHALIEYEDA
jgi:adenine phosphoribosyltransferase